MFKIKKGKTIKLIIIVIVFVLYILTKVIWKTIDR